MRHLVPLICCIACSSSPAGPLPDAKSLDYVLEPDGGHSGYVGRFWQDSTPAIVQIRSDHSTVSGAVVRYHATSGEVAPAMDTSSSTGHTTYVWRVSTAGPSNGDLYFCVEASDGCMDQHLLGFRFIPAQ